MTQSFCVFGGAHIDRIGTFDTDFHLGQSHPGHWSQGLGGVAANVACHLQRFSADPVSFAGLFADDRSAIWVQDQLADIGLKLMPGQALPVDTPSYTALHNRDGGVIAGLSDMALYQLLNEPWAKQAAHFAQDNSVWITDTNISCEALSVLAAMKGKNLLFVVAVSPAKMEPVTKNLRNIDGLICNLEEAREVLGAKCGDAAQAAQEFGKLGLPHAVVTDGSRSCASLCKTGSGSVLNTAAPGDLSNTAHLTGAGDAFAAAYLYSAFKGEPENTDMALKRAVNCATLAVQQPQTCPSIKWQDICDMKESNK